MGLLIKNKYSAFNIHMLRSPWNVWRKVLDEGVHQVIVWTVRSFCLPSSLELVGDAVYKQVWACVSHLDIYSYSILSLWEHRAQYLIMCGIELVLLLLLLLFCNTLLSYSLVPNRTITVMDIPVRRNTLSTRTEYSRVRQYYGR